jgi:hypothetical protein
MTTSTARQNFREVLATLAAKTKAKIPTLNGRVEKATRLALMGDVELHSDGHATVCSSSDPTRRYEIIDGTCTCRDWEQAPEHLCQHRLAAGFVRKAATMLPPSSPEVTPPASAPLGEAPASVNVRLTIGGREVQLTLRDADEGRLLARLETVLHRFPIPETAAEDTRQCPRHHVPMQVNHKDGRSWWSHKTDQGWCKGR